MTAPTRNPPSAVLEARLLVGCWDSFPVSQHGPYRVLRDLIPPQHVFEGPGGAGAYELAEVVAGLEAGADSRQRLAVRRAVLSLGLELAGTVDDSYGHLGDVLGEALQAYAGAGWRATGIAPEVFWSDFLGILTLLDNHGLTCRREQKLFRRAGARAHLDEIDRVVTALHAEFTAARMPGHAAAVLVLHAHAPAATAVVDRFTPAALRLCSDSWQACEALVGAALERGRSDVARAVLTATDVPGFHQQRIRGRLADFDT